MSMVEYMYKLLYGRRLTTVDAPTQSCSLPGDVLRWRLSRALQQCASMDGGSSPNVVVSRRCSESTIVAPRLQCAAAAASSPPSAVGVTPGTLATPHQIGDSSNLFTDLLMTASCHDSSLGHVTWPDAESHDHQQSDVKPSCRYSRCSSPLLMDKVDGSADCASMYQLPLTGLLTAEEYQTADLPFSPSAAYYVAETSACLPSYVSQSTSSTGDDFDGGAMTSPPFQTRSVPPTSVVKYDDDRMACCCDRSENGPGANVDCPCAESHVPWQQVNEYYSLTAGYSFTCSRSVVYDARFAARWQHRKERQRHCHSNRSSGSAAAASTGYLVQDSIASGASSVDSTSFEPRCHSTHVQPPLAASSSGGIRTSRKSVAGIPTVCASLTGSTGLQCAVCGDNAACQHYGVRTCEGCKGFFKRTVQKNSKYVCLSGRNCIIDKRRRNRCQYCRFQKCLAVGMVKEVVRRDTLKGRRGRLPSKPKTCQSRASSSSAAVPAAAQPVAHIRPPQSPPVSLITALVRAYVDSSPDLPSLDYSQCYEIDLSHCSNATSKRSRQLCYSLVERSTEVIVQWAESVPGFIDLGSEDRTILIRGALIELLTLRLAYRFSPCDSSMTFCDGTVLHITQCKNGFGDDWFELVSNLSGNFHRQPGSVDLSMVSCLAALALFTDRCLLRDPHRVELLQEAVLDTLRSHCAYRCGALSCSSRPGAGRLMVARALNGLVELRSVAKQSATVLRQMLSADCAANDYHTSVLQDSLSELHEM